jgi:hypothetical protein
VIVAVAAFFAAQAVNPSVSNEVYQLMSFADCGPPMAGGSTCNDDPAKKAPAIQGLLKKCGIGMTKSVSATDGWIGFRFVASEKAIGCVRKFAPAGTEIELTTDTDK